MHAKYFFKKLCEHIVWTSTSRKFSNVLPKIIRCSNRTWHKFGHLASTLAKERFYQKIYYNYDTN